MKMNARLRAMRVAPAAGALLLALALAAFAAGRDDDDDAAAPAAGAPALSPDQQRAAGIVVAHAVNASVPQQDAAIAVVLDGSALIADAGEADAAAAGARAASAEVERARGLYQAGAGASLKALQAAEAELAHTRAQADAVGARFAARWKPVAAMTAAARQALLADVTAGRALLLRADLPGRHLVGSLPDRALLDVDGVSVPGKVLGLLASGGEEAQGVAMLVLVRDPPPGLGAGARVPARLLGAQRSGVLVPRDALLYGENGALVYKQLKAQPGDKQARYAPVAVKLLQPQGDSWLVEGVDDDDDLVVHGAGVLWSLQGIVGHAAGDIDDDD